MKMLKEMFLTLKEKLVTSSKFPKAKHNWKGARWESIDTPKIR